MLDEELLEVWLRLTSVIDNQRLAASQAAAGQYALSFNEAMICGLLAKAQESGGCLTASDLCRRTRILKSQMNSILRSLEGKELISRRKSQQDGRQVELQLLPEGEALYQESHRRSVALTGRLTDRLGEKEAQDLLTLLRRTVDIFDDQQQEV